MKTACGLCLFLTFLLTSCEVPKKENKTAPTVTPTMNKSKVYNTPEIGMNFAEFWKLCKSTKERTNEDDISSAESDTARVNRIRLGYSASRSKNECWGTFTFIDGKLDTIYR